MKITGKNTVICHCPTMERFETRQKSEVTSQLDVSRLPENIGQLRKMLEVAHARGFHTGVELTMDRLNELQE